MAEQTRRPTAVDVTRTAPLMYEARNSRGGVVVMGGGATEEFTPVELLMAALGGCASMDVEVVTGRRSQPSSLSVAVSADRVKDATDSRLEDIDLAFTVRFPEGEDGDRARDLLERAIRDSHDRLCTVARTVERGTPVAMHEAAD